MPFTNPFVGQTITDPFKGGSIFSATQGFSDIVVSLLGQSLHVQLVTEFSGAGSTEITSAFEEFGNSCTVVNGATGGSSILKTVNATNHWVNDDAALADGPALTTWINSLTASQKAGDNVIAFWAQTTADADALNKGTVSKAEQKAGLEYIISRVRAVVPNLLAFVINPAHAHNVKPDVGWQISRDIQLELIEAGTAQRGVEFYDLDQSDGVHLTQAGYEEFGRRIGRRAAQIAGYSLSGAQGPYVDSVALFTDEFTVDVIQDAGTAIATPVTLTNSREYIDDDGTVVEPTAITRPSANQLRYTLPEGSAPVNGSELEFLPIYGSGNFGALTNKNVIKDNATNPLPLQSGRITMTNEDPFQALDNVHHYIDARGSAKTYSSGTIVDTIAQLAGTTGMTEITTGKGPQFTTNYLEFKDTDDQIFSDAAFASGQTQQTIIIAGKMPATLPAGFTTIWGFASGTNVTASFNGRFLYSASAGAIEYQRDQSNALVSVQSVSAGDNFCLAFVIESARVMKIYRAQDISGGSILPHATFDPNDVPTVSAQKSYLGTDGALSGLAFRCYSFTHTTDVLTNQEIVDCLTYANTRFSLGL